MFVPVKATSKSGKKYVKSYRDTITGEVISNRKYQEIYGSVAKKGFSTIEKKAAASPTAKHTKVKRELFKLARTEHTYYELDIDGDWISQIYSILEQRHNYYAFWLELELDATPSNVKRREQTLTKKKKGKVKIGNTIHVQTHATDDIEMMLDELKEILEWYEVELVSATFVTVGETN